MYEAILMGVFAVIGGVVWAVRIEGRQRTHEAEDKVIHVSMQDSLERLEVKIDKLTDHLITNRPTKPPRR